MKLGRFSQTLMLLCLVGAGSFYMKPASAHVFVCNEGSVDLWVMGFEAYGGLLLPKRWWIDGWYLVEPDDCENVNSRPDATVNLVFGVVKPDGAFGIVKYSSRGAVTGVPDAVDEFCVSPDHLKEDGWGASKYLPPCAAGFVAAPSSGAVYIRGGATMTLNVTPTVADFDRFQAVVRAGTGSGRNAGFGGDAASNPETNTPRSPGALETIFGAYNTAESNRAKLNASCRRAGAEWDASRRESYCRCMSDAALDSLDDRGIANVIAAWTPANLDALVGKGFYAREAAACPSIPEAPSRSRSPQLGDPNVGIFVMVVPRDSPSSALTLHESEEAAENVAASLPYDWKVTLVGPFGSGTYLVQVGPFATTEQAEAIVEQLRSLGYPLSHRVLDYIE